VREAFPSVASGTTLVDGGVEEKDELVVISEMNDSTGKQAACGSRIITKAKETP
jgi:hypothetical protein